MTNNELIKTIYEFGKDGDIIDPRKHAGLLEYLYQMITCEIPEKFCSRHQSHSIEEYLKLASKEQHSKE